MDSSQVGTELPRYKCHKEVRAAKITGFRQNGEADMPDLLLGEIGGIVTLLPDWHAKHKPQVGGYYVVYDDSYKSFSPAKAFEDGYTSIEKSHNDSVIEQEIQAKGKTAPRVTSCDIQASIASEHYFTAAQGEQQAQEDAHEGRSAVLNSLKLVTICVLILQNGHKIVGVNEGPVSAANFDPEMGRQFARTKAIDQIWPLMGYQLKEQLYQRMVPPVPPEAPAP